MARAGDPAYQLSFGLSEPQGSAPAVERARVRPRAKSSAEAGLQLSLSWPEARSADPARIAPPESPAPPRPSIRGQMNLEQGLRRIIGPEVLVSLHTNTTTMVSFRQRGRALYVRAHAMFADAPPPVVEALAGFVRRQQTPADSQLLDAWIGQHQNALTQARSEAIRPQPTGEHHDLQQMFDQLNAAHFEGRVEARITWGTAAQNQRRRSIKMGAYVDELKLIRIHPALDQPFVPDYFVEYVVFQEMLHQVHGVDEVSCGRRAIHTEAFRADERRYPRYQEARRWERLHLSQLLRY